MAETSGGNYMYVATGNEKVRDINICLLNNILYQTHQQVLYVQYTVQLPCFV
jgi:hypothetical protein